VGRVGAPCAFDAHVLVIVFHQGLPCRLGFGAKRGKRLDRAFLQLNVMLADHANERTARTLARNAE
jgi:hypothetical protein